MRGTADHPAGFSAPDDARLVALAAEEVDHGILIVSAPGLVVYANRAFCRLFDYRPEEISGLRAVEILTSSEVDGGMMERIRAEIGAGRTFHEEVPVLNRRGETLWMSSMVKPLYDFDGRLAHYLLVFSDVSESRQIQQLQRDMLELIAQDRPLAEVMAILAERVEAMAPDVVCSILSVDHEQRLYTLAAPSLPDAYCEAIDGVKAGPRHGSCGTAAFRNEQVIVTDIATDPLWHDFKALALPLGLAACWSSPITLRDGRVAGTFAFYYRQPRGPSDWHEMIVRACVNLCVVALERHEAKASIARLAYYDSLTGLPNRAKLQAEMVRRFDETTAPEAALLFIDIDHFKDVNDTLGHAIGDQFLVEVARRIKRSVWAEDIVARHGGDEFVIVLAGADAPRAQRVAEILLQAIAIPVVVDGVSLPASASIGIAICPQDGTDAATLMRNADTAMYCAKGEGRGTYRFFARAMNQMAQDRLLLGALLRDAIDTDQLSLHYQPQIDARTGAVSGVEALARWHHPALGFVPPSRFIPLAEDCGLIEAIGETCLALACDQLQAWDEQGFRVPSIAVNISPIHFRNPGLPETAAKLLESRGLAGHRLTIEITESVMMQAYPAAISNAARLRELGVVISMDDFGTGYSSLGHLAQLPVSELKIDRSFMANLEENEAVQALVTAVIRIGESLKLRVVAEGVETVAQRRFVEALGCDVLQGYLFSEPMPAATFASWLRAYESDTRTRGAA